MAVFQCNSPVQLHICYERYNLLEGQLVAIDENNKDLLKHLENHPNFRGIEDETLLKLAPPLHLIKQPEDPYRMPKQHIINELRSYGIFVDPYDFSQKLSMQLGVARKMLKRNFITVLTPQGYPIFIDRMKLPVPVINNIDENLSEPEEPQGEFFSEEISNEPEIKKFESEPIVTKVKQNESDSVMFIDPIVDENEVHKGKIFEDFMVDMLEQEYRVPVEIERAEKLLKFEPKEEVEIVEEKKVFEYENKEQFLWLIELKKNFMLNEVTEEDKEKFEEVKWSKISTDALEIFLRAYNSDMEYVPGEKGVKLRWKIVKKAQEIFDEVEDKIKMAFEINILQKRYEEIVKLEPNYRNFSEVTIKRRITDLTKYGMDVVYTKETNILRYAQKAYTLAKLGLQIPETDEEINEKLKKYQRESVIK